MTKCRVCDKQGARDLSLYVSVGRAQHSFVIRVCRDCWRTFEAMIDSATHAHQLALVDGWADVSAGTKVRFVW